MKRKRRDKKQPTKERAVLRVHSKLTSQMQRASKFSIRVFCGDPEMRPGVELVTLDVPL